MDDILKALYNSFYTAPEHRELIEAVEANRSLLREKLSHEDRKLVLRIIDDMGLIIQEQSFDSFVCGFKLAWRLANELNNYKENERSTPTGIVGLGALSLSEEDT